MQPATTHRQEVDAPDAATADRLGATAKAAWLPLTTSPLFSHLPFAPSEDFLCCAINCALSDLRRRKNRINCRKHSTPECPCRDFLVRERENLAQSCLRQIRLRVKR